MQSKIEDLIAIVKMQLGTTDVSENEHLVEALGAESADIVNIVAAIEEKYDIEIDESELANITTIAGLQKLVERHMPRNR